MADRYWVGGAGTWDATTTTNWSATSGGAGGASAPTSVDNVIFNSASNATAYAVTVGTNANALDITIAGPATGNVTITSGATAVINCYGSWTNAATGVVFTTTTGATINFLATTTGKTITTNAVTLGGMQIIFNGVGGAWTLGSALTTTQSIVVTAGSFSTSGSNYALATNQISSSNSNVRSISLNASVVTINGGTFVNFTTTTNLTFNAGTSTITASSASNTLNSGGLTFYNVTFSGVTATTHTINGANTFNNLTFTTRTTDGIGAIVVLADQTISGTLTLGAANTAVRRLSVRSDTIGTQRTLTVATIATLSDVDFQDTVAAGASGTFSGTRLGNCTNNSNITFGAGKTVYWNLAGAQNWSAVAWATSSGGAPAVNNFPLAQDTAIFDNTGSVTGTITIQIGWNLPAINITKTGAMTLANGTQTPRIFGGLTLQAATVTTGTGAWTYAAYGVASIFTSNTATFTPPLTIQAPTGTVTLADGFTQPSTVTTTFTAGTLNFVSYTLTTGIFNSSNSNTRVLAFGTGKIVLTATSGTIFTTTVFTNLTVTGTSLVQATSGGAGTRTITVGSGAISEANAINFDITAGSDIVSFFGGGGGAKNINFTGFSGTIDIPSTKVVYGNFDAGSATSITGTSTITFAATSGTKTIRTNALTYGGSITFDGIGGTFVMQDALTLGSTRTLTMTNGTLKLKSGTTNTVGSIATSGTNQKFLSATTPGTQATLSDASGTNSVSYLTIQDSNATGGAVFQAFTSNFNVDSGNNTGWKFSNLGGNFLMFF